MIDDKDGRKIAESTGITCVGTVGLLLRYYRLDADAFTAALDELVAKGFRLAPREYRKIVLLALSSLIPPAKR